MGKWLYYEVKPGLGDRSVTVYNTKTAESQIFPRGKSPQFSEDGKFLIFEATPDFDTLQTLRRKKIAKKDLPGDTVLLYRLRDGHTSRFAQVKSYELPQKWSGRFIYQREVAQIPSDTSSVDSLETTPKFESDENGSILRIFDLKTLKEDSIPFVTQFVVAEEAPVVFLETSGDDGNIKKGLYRYFCETKVMHQVDSSGNSVDKMAVSADGEHIASLINRDTTGDNAVLELLYCDGSMDKMRSVLDTAATFLPDDWELSSNRKLWFSESGKNLFYGISPQRIEQDTSLLEEEIVQVQVWTYLDQELYPRQNVRLDQEKKRSYLCLFDTESGKHHEVGTTAMPEVILPLHGDGQNFLTYDEGPYLRASSWLGYSRKDVWLYNKRQGNHQLVAKGIQGNPSFSPAGVYLYWFDRTDTTWYAYGIEHQKLISLLQPGDGTFYDERNDRPMHPYSYGSAGWTEDDTHFLVYDRYDIWQVDPSGKEKPMNLTNGREDKTRYRYVRLDKDDPTISTDEKLHLHSFSEQTKDEGYAALDFKSASMRALLKGPMKYTSNLVKARDEDCYTFTEENFSTYPDIHFTRDWKERSQISRINPQQDQYAWGDIEAIKWMGTEGKNMDGLLVKPPDFDPMKKYPMIVYFYERYSDNLHKHWIPFPHRSIINFSFYASRGYLIFIPDIIYKTGYPGKSAYDAVVSGTTALINQGFVNATKVGMQGHSWGGYQSAYIVTKTNLFKCAESGAPVSNMTSAYGGIRWRSGRSRMFQYEHAQSRIGGTLWEKPMYYIENSPLFFADNVETPLLIMHNDHDGAVPWYQGIELFVALRRLNKPVWMLNYVGEPHWPVKYQNRKDFQKRMQQFFDHFLKDEPKPEWMDRGVPAIEMGIKQGYEYRER